MTRIQAIALALTFVLGAFTTACVGSGDVDDGDDEARVPVQASTLTPQETRAPAPSTTTTSSYCSGSKVKTSCTQQKQVLDFVKQ